MFRKLKCCVVDMWKGGMREREAKILYELNKQADIIVKTPAGVTDEITVNDVAKQGTEFGSKLCCSSTGSVNTIGKKPQTVISPNLSVGAQIFVDDIMGVGSRSTVKQTMENCAEMEKKKKMEFSTDKSKYMIIQTGRETSEEIEVDRVATGQGRQGRQG